MSEQEMMQENERLKRELAAMTTSRERLMSWFCQAMQLEPVTDQEIKEAMSREATPIDELLRELLPPDMYYLIDENEGARLNGVVASPSSKS
jgi:hypothetical protein